jgi:hypothetical protein
MNLLEKLNIIKKEIPQYIEINKKVHEIETNDAFIFFLTLLVCYGITSIFIVPFLGVVGFIVSLVSLLFVSFFQNYASTFFERKVNNDIINFGTTGGKSKFLKLRDLLKIKKQTNKLSTYGKEVFMLNDLSHKSFNNKEDLEVMLIIINSLIRNMSEKEFLRDKKQIIIFIEQNFKIETRVEILIMVSNKIKSIETDKDNLIRAKERLIIKNQALNKEEQKYLKIIDEESCKRKRNEFILKEI